MAPRPLPIDMVMPLGKCWSMAAKTGAALLRDRLDALGWTQSHLAERIRATPAAVSRWLSGERVPDLEMAHRIETVTGVLTQSWLRTGTDA